MAMGVVEEGADSVSHSTQPVSEALGMPQEHGEAQDHKKTAAVEEHKSLGEGAKWGNPRSPTNPVVQVVKLLKEKDSKIGYLDSRMQTAHHGGYRASYSRGTPRYATAYHRQTNWNSVPRRTERSHRSRGNADVEA